MKKINKKEVQWIFNRIKSNKGIIVSSLEELASYYRPGRVEGNLLNFLKENVEKYGYTMCTHHSSINGNNVYYFPPEYTKQ